ncbi:SRPBCC family protein [Streptomyces kaniharaensis]|uniref:SRPBCC family protein n=1 Tax=Streptomyces kaniharaensis TaxID=212423 RepID=A0A6N7KZ22_9ACTN|nr:SRPBCC family protein [Streptomyces kaniharaensis]MQS15617.1 SRPBCC family protein [Streptomyces kaniharaensis]
MRYADGPRTHCEVFVRAAVEDVWALVTDINLPTRLSPELQRVGWLDGADGPALGARFEGFNHHERLGEWRTVSHVTELTDLRAFAWIITDVDGRFGEATVDPAKPLATWRFDLTPEDGGTRLRQSVLIGPGRNGVTLAIDQWPDREEQIIDFRLAELGKAMTATLEGIKSLAEQGNQG